MRKLTPQRRAAVIASSCAAIIPGTVLLRHSTHPSNAMDATFGFLFGISLTLCIGLFIRSRRCA